jgi:hypothetical protein
VLAGLASGAAIRAAIAAGVVLVRPAVPAGIKFLETRVEHARLLNYLIGKALTVVFSWILNN